MSLSTLGACLFIVKFNARKLKETITNTALLAFYLRSMQNFNRMVTYHQEACLLGKLLVTNKLHNSLNVKSSWNA